MLRIKACLLCSFCQKKILSAVSLKNVFLDGVRLRDEDGNAHIPLFNCSAMFVCRLLGMREPR